MPEAGEGDLTVLVRNVIAARQQLDTAWGALKAHVHPDEAGTLAIATEPILSLKQVAVLLQCSPRTLRNGYKRGRYPFFFREGVRLLARRQSVERWVAVRVKRG